LIGPETASPRSAGAVRYAPYSDPANHVAYFHATYADHPKPELARPGLLDTRKSRGQRGLVGPPGWNVVHLLAHARTCPRSKVTRGFFFDDSLTPQAQGPARRSGAAGRFTGAARNGPCRSPAIRRAVNLAAAKNERTKSSRPYRFLLVPTSCPSAANARICLEHGGNQRSSEHYETVTYWLRRPQPVPAETDELQIGDVDSEKAHRYHSPDAAAYEIESRYEWGVDHLSRPGDLSRAPRPRPVHYWHIQFTVKLEATNFGVMLRRKLDYAFPNQRARCFVADASRGQEESGPDWKPAGIWYLAGSNTCVYSNPKDELGATQHVVQTSNRRFRDDEFLCPRALTAGRSAIRVRIRFTPSSDRFSPATPSPICVGANSDTAPTVSSCLQRRSFLDNVRGYSGRRRDR